MRVPPSTIDSLPAPAWLRDLPVVVGNLLPIAGVLCFGWSPTALLLVYQAELAAICVWTVVKIPFAHKRPNNAIDDRFRLLGPLQEKRGAVGVPGRLPPVYPRNVPTLVFAVVIAPVVVGLAFVAFALTRPTVTEADAAAFLLGGAAVFLTRGIDTYREYFRGNGYREHSPRSLLLVPFKYLFVVGLLFMAFLSLESTVETTAILDPRRSVLVLAVGKLAYDIRASRLERDDDRRSLFSRLYGSKRTEIEPEPVETPDAEPGLRTSMSRTAAIVDALLHGLAYLAGAIGFVTALIVGFGVLASSVGIVVVGLGLGGFFVAVRATTRYLRYGTLEYHCYDDVLVAYDRLLGEPQAKVEKHAITDITRSEGLIDRLLGTETLDFDVYLTDDTTMELFVPGPEMVDTDDDANESVAMVVPHLSDPRSITETLGLSWHLDDSAGE
ncbi:MULTISPECIES: DUF6498-containing protein [unclassified Halorhabdus]|uniref:DUF6498-containing protein n=1 Tax=unclassified Halorhabdus TaxID=2621901 RepID=UPI0023D9D069|nr:MULTISPECIES: DUF6498-containing protein [unclassified Halorhabdus]WEL18969.1 putative membrane protein [Halorhabdus sp. SVX81]WEL22798.1 putative membrane protein [Halorhabdus sp. BNX81]